MEGKTLTTANLATAMAKAEGDVLLIDADLRRPTLHKLLNVDGSRDSAIFWWARPMNSYCSDDGAPSVPHARRGHPPQPLGTPGLRAHAGPAEPHRGALLDHPGFTPLISVTDAAILSTCFGGALGHQGGAGARKAARDATDRLLELHAHLLGTVLNNVPYTGTATVTISITPTYTPTWKRQNPANPEKTGRSPGLAAAVGPQTHFPPGLLKINRLLHFAPQSK